MKALLNAPGGRVPATPRGSVAAFFYVPEMMVGQVVPELVS